MPPVVPALAELPPPRPPAGERSLKQNMAFAVGGMGAFQACQFLVIVLLAKFTPDDLLGQVVFSLAVATPIVAFCSLELRGALVADAAGEFSFGTYRALRSVMMGAAGAALLGLSAWELASDRRIVYALVFAGMCAGKLVLGLAEVGWGLFQKRERLDLVAQSVLLRGGAMLAAFGVLLPLGHYLQGHGVFPAERRPDFAAGATCLYLLASLAVLVGFDQRRVADGQDYDPTWNWRAVAKLARQTLPLGLVLLLLHLSDSLPRLFIERHAEGKAALGRFGALATVTLAANLVVFQAANAAANRLARAYQTDVAAFGHLALRLLGMAAVVGLAMIIAAQWLGRWLLAVLYRADYVAHFDEFRLIVAGQALALLTNVFGVLVLQMRLFWLQVPAQLLVLGSTAAAAWLLIPGADNPVRAGAWTMFWRCSVHVTVYAGCVLAGLLFRARLLQGPDTVPTATTAPAVLDSP